VLVIRNDSLVVENTPVPLWEARARWFNNALVLRSEMRLVLFLAWVRDSVSSGHGTYRRSLPRSGTDEDSLIWLRVRHITEDLSRINEARGSRLVLVHLPALEDYWSRESDPWREGVEATSAGGKFVFVDLVRELRGLPADSVDQMFIGHDFPGSAADAAGHYSVFGHQWVAEQIHRRLIANPTIEARLRRFGPPPQVGRVK
jgi:hypothetical protein